MARRNVIDIIKQVGLEEADRRLRQKDLEIARLKPFEAQVSDARPDRLRRALAENRKIWLTKDIPKPGPTIYIDDPIYDQLVIEDRLTSIVRHPLIERLAHVKQLSFSYLTF